jgi:tol-pal system protein YbgF
MKTLMARHSPRSVLAAAAFLLCTGPATAGIFDDDEARRAILDLRQRIEALRRETDQKLLDEARRQAEEIGSLRRGLLDLQNQWEATNGEAAKIRGQGEQLGRDMNEAQRRQAEQIKRMEERLQRMEPFKVSHEGGEFLAEAGEKRMFDAALASFRGGEFEAAQNTFGDFLGRYPQSGYASSALFWLGNAQFVLKNYSAAVASFRKMIARSPAYARVPEAWLAISNCQLELKDGALARKTLEDLVANFPQSEAAEIAKERLARMNKQ